MYLKFKIAGGCLAIAAATALGFVFWPDVKPQRIAQKSAVERPIFVVSSSAKPVSLAAVTTAPLPAPVANTDKVAFTKLAAALQMNTPAKTASSAPSALGPKPTAVSLTSNESTSAAATPMLAQGLVALASGDIAGARRFLEIAVEAGDPRALFALGDAYNPNVLKRLGVVGAPGDPALARSFYNRAVAAGLAGARERLIALDSNAQ